MGRNVTMQKWGFLANSTYHFAILSPHQPATPKVATHPVFAKLGGSIPGAYLLQKKANSFLALECH